MGYQYIFFYAKDGRIAGRNPIWVQGTLTTLIQIFERVDLYKNLGNTKSRTYTPSFVWDKMVKKAYNMRAMGEGNTSQEWKRTRVSCGECDKTMAESSLQQHVASIHWRILAQKREAEIRGGRPTEFPSPKT